MKLRAQAILVLLCLTIGRGLYAQANQDSALSLQGFSGILNTPNAHVQQEGTFDLLYSNQEDKFPKVGVPKWEDNYLFSVGLFNFAEVGGSLTNAAFVPPASAIRHLSMNWKLSTDPLTSRFRFSPALAVGMQDVGGQTHFIETKYVAGSVDPLGWLRVSAGYGLGPDRMKGAFGGMELRAYDWVTLLGDYDTRNTNAGVRLIAPALPYIPARLTVTFSTPVQHTQGLVISGGLNIPLDFKRSTRHGDASTMASGKPPVQRTLWGALTARKVQPPAPMPSSQSNDAEPVPVMVPLDSLVKAGTVMPVPKPISPSNNVEPGSLEALRDRLVKAGFVNVRVGLQGKTLVVEYENIRYNHSELDAIGVVAGIVSQTAVNDAEQLRLVIRRKGLALLQIETQLLPLRNWLEASEPTNAPTLIVSQKLTSEDGVNFVAGNDNPGRLKPSVMVYPSLTTLVGTEYGVFDYQLSIRPELQLPLWRGATGVARWDLPVAWSGNLDSGQVYASYHTPAQLDRLMFFQALPLAPGLVANLGGGKILTTTNGMLNELSWTLGGGMNRVKVLQSWGRDSGATRSVLLGSYRFFLAHHDLAFEGTAGRFWGQDTGSMVSMQRFFGDTSVSLYFKDTVTPNDSKRWLQAGIQLEFPLTPRRDMKARPIQIRGNEDWSYAQETGIASSSAQSANYIEPNLATVPEPTQALSLYFYDRERLNADYILSHTERIREAWRFFRNRL
ncbi:YjbH domain-containing protein [Granulicella sp. 5B5]|uniref:YjbH domain-containing protein n=1 Tax=Granulicella sp. 5B5 TaxID=1617967 RepID=UPI0015F3E02C|nr:YjbH domain-containing protein [Granulicella sp. 5B5]